jgi:hypothetical protein
MIFNFAILCKVHFSFKKWGSNLKTDSANCFCSRTPELTHSKRDVVRGHIGAPPYVP